MSPLPHIYRIVCLLRNTSSRMLRILGLCIKLQHFWAGKLILGSIGCTVWMDLFVAKVGKGKITFQVTEFVHTLQGVFKHL